MALLLALDATRDPASFILFEQKGTKDDLLDPNPRALDQFLDGSHPDPLARIHMAEAWRRDYASSTQ